MEEELVAAPDTPQGQHGERDQVGDEVVVVPLSNAVAHPGAVVVKPGNTHITCCQAPNQAQSLTQFYRSIRCKNQSAVS